MQYRMVMPLTNEDRPKCYMCAKDFTNIEKLREHQKNDHGSVQDSVQEHGSAPGDVTVF